MTEIQYIKTFWVDFQGTGRYTSVLNRGTVGILARRIAQCRRLDMRDEMLLAQDGEQLSDDMLVEDIPDWSHLDLFAQGSNV